MKVNELKSLIESAVRKVVREELDYRFEKLNEQLDNSRTTSRRDIVDPPPANKNTASKKFQESKNFFREKFGAAFDDITPFDDTPETPSILDENNLRTLSSTNHQSGVLRALTRDYSDMIKAMDKF